VAVQPATVARWEAALSRGAVTVTQIRLSADRREQALDYLIAGHWLISEAEDQNLAVSPEAIQQRTAEQLGPLSNEAGVDRALKRMGLTLEDVQFKAQAELSAEALRQKVSEGVPDLSHTYLAGYYKAHQSSLWHEYRIVDLVEHLLSRSAALTAAKRLGTGRRFTERAIHEIVLQLIGSEAAHAVNRELVHAIYAAPAGQISQPIFYAGLWIIFIVRSIRHSPLPLSVVEPAVQRAAKQGRVLSAFEQFFSRHRREQQAQTTCGKGYVVPGCSQSGEQLDPEAVRLFSA
jgi:hypothetical protein